MPDRLSISYTAREVETLRKISEGAMRDALLPISEMTSWTAEDAKAAGRIFAKIGQAELAQLGQERQIGFVAQPMPTELVAQAEDMEAVTGEPIEADSDTRMMEPLEAESMIGGQWNRDPNWNDKVVHEGAPDRAPFCYFDLTINEREILRVDAEDMRRVRERFWEPLMTMIRGPRRMQMSEFTERGDALAENLREQAAESAIRVVTGRESDIHDLWADDKLPIYLTDISALVDPVAYMTSRPLRPGVHYVTYTPAHDNKAVVCRIREIIYRVCVENDYPLDSGFDPGFDPVLFPEPFNSPDDTVITALAEYGINCIVCERDQIVLKGHLFIPAGYAMEPQSITEVCDVTGQRRIRLHPDFKALVRDGLASIIDRGSDSHEPV